jgi:hypothetical protein
MKFSLKTAKLGAVLALALGAALPASAIATPAAAAGYQDVQRDYHDGGDHRDFDRDHHVYRGHWEFRDHRWQWFDGFWFGR